ncbi:sigma-54-dependent transcriptional regulator [Paracoccus beibuensis]|uniref:sigma-54-dependent transcriptional regulator n=1 Tax=Paracoccus beibuensis TaxID=547602 RepID=UPI00223F425E|nr:sigma-54 dependent transcriptional regulator [Paracoccus beibuensis]
MTPLLRVRLIDDDDDLRAAQRQTLTLAGLEVEEFSAAEPALAGLSPDYPGVVLTDVRMPGMDGIQLFQRLHALDPDLPVILLTGHGDVQMAVSALQDGAYDFRTKPVAADRLIAALRRALATRALVLENRRLRLPSLDAAAAHPPLMGDSAAMVRLREMLHRVAEAESDALIRGPAGAGKSLVARAIHQQGRRRSRALVTVDCASVDAAGFEVLLTGQEAAPGSRLPRRPGLLEGAHRGILCLERLDDLPRHLQTRLLALVEAGEFWLPGAAAPRPLDLQILATTGPSGDLHEGLFYRLSRAILEVPPLSARREDVPALFRHFLQAAADRLSRSVPPLTDLLMARLSTHGWPGNLRELQGQAESHVLGVGPWTPDTAGGDRPALPDLVAACEAGLIRDALREARGNATEAMTLLGLPRKTFYDKLSRHGIRPADFRSQ